jgi:hypothetical protein
MPLAIEFDDAITGRSDRLIEAINNAAEEGLKIGMPQIFEQLNQLSAAAGATTDAEGQPLTWALILKAWENMEIEFDKDGKPTIGIFVGPEMHEQFRNLPPLTHEEQQAFNELLERKKAQFNARQRRRKLS